MSTEPIDATSLDDLGEVTFTIDIPRPDGRIVRVRLRTLTDAQVWEIRNSITWPTAPIRDIKRIEGEITPVYDYGNADYLKANRKADRDLARHILAASLVMDIPGETLEERAAEVDKKLGQWATQYLIGILNRLQEIDNTAIENAVRSFRLPKDAGIPGNGSGGEVTGLIHDQDLGISKEQLPTIFNRFHQVDGSGTRADGGMGLGLYIVRKYTELLGATIRVASKLGQGSTFVLQVPCGPDMSAAPRSEELFPRDLQPATDFL